MNFFPLKFKLRTQEKKLIDDKESGLSGASDLKICCIAFDLCVVVFFFFRCFPYHLYLGFEILNFTDGAAEQHREDHSQKLNNADADTGGEDVGEVLMEQSFQFRCAALKSQ